SRSVVCERGLAVSVTWCPPVSSSSTSGRRTTTCAELVRSTQTRPIRPAESRGLEEAGERLGVAGRSGSAVPGPRDDGPLGAQLALEHVADRVEDRAVAARNDELRKLRRRELAQWNLGLVRRALAERRAGAGFQVRRQRVGQRHVAADERQEEVQVRARLARRLREAVQEALDR